MIHPILINEVTSPEQTRLAFDWMSIAYRQAVYNYTTKTRLPQPVNYENLASEACCPNPHLVQSFMNGEKLVPTGNDLYTLIDYTGGVRDWLELSDIISVDPVRVRNITVQYSALGAKIDNASEFALAKMNWFYSQASWRAIEQKTTELLVSQK